MWAWLKKLFGFVESQESRVKRFSYAAGILVAANNPAYVALATVGLKEVEAAIGDGLSKEVINSMFKRAMGHILKITEKPAEKAAIAVLFSEMSFSPDTEITPSIEIPIIKSAVTGFLEGMTL
jgi:hypothetical protein